MKPYVRGKNIYFREIRIEDAAFIYELRSDTRHNKYLSPITDDPNDQVSYISQYLQKNDEYYFIICNLSGESIGTIRIYDIIDQSFCWGSWILNNSAPTSAAIESALLIYDFAFFSLHYKSSHFDVRLENKRVLDFHIRFGGNIVRMTSIDAFFEYRLESYLAIRPRYMKFLP